MISYAAMRLGLRTHARTLEVLTTGSGTFAVTAVGFTRSTGSFLADGFRKGMEVTAAGFDASNNATHVVTAVTALLLTCTGCSGLAERTGRTLSVALPSQQSWENRDFTPTPGTPYVEEQFIPGPSLLRSIGPGATLRVTPQYGLKVFVPEDMGSEAPDAYVDGLVQLFAPRTSIVLSTGDALRVRTDTGPFVGQLLRRKDGWVTVPVTFPLQLFTINAN